MLKRMKRLTVIVVLLLVGLVAATAISGESEVEKGAKLVAKEGKVTQINLPLREEDEISRMNLQIPQEKRWMRTFGRPFSCDNGNSVQQTNDGGYIVAGRTASFLQDEDFWLIKVDANGNKEWDKKFGGLNSDKAKSVQQTNDGGYIIAGNTYRYDQSDIWLIKIDSNGNKEWDRTFGGSKGDWVLGEDGVQQTNDGGYIITGDTTSYGAGHADAWLIKVDADGSEEWNKTFGGSRNDWGHEVQHINGGYIVVGGTHSYAAPQTCSDLWLIKTDEKGIEEWNKTFGGRYGDDGYSFQQTNDGGYIITGSTESNPPRDIWLIKVDANGNKEWDKLFGKPGKSWFDCGYSVQQTTDGGYIITGSYGMDITGLLGDLVLIKTDASGNEEWKKIFGRRGRDYGCCVRQTNDGGYIITGRKGPLIASPFTASFTDVWLIKTDKRGNAMR